MARRQKIIHIIQNIQWKAVIFAIVHGKTNHCPGSNATIHGGHDNGEPFLQRQGYSVVAGNWLVDGEFAFRRTCEPLGKRFGVYGGQACACLGADGDIL